ncbi:hypothetical protein AQUCO_01400556v1 [Aquilegia coerulea]|uniref:Uncharacterized protein n=1 Tax=Aquilegia coerulea TaxID=218851 RepID=A0A2G5DX67_AQUCA|nr:hypothetical protein AQUCO_01400556v1 [Aquilegia coerulea]
MALNRESVNNINNVRRSPMALNRESVNNINNVRLQNVLIPPYGMNHLSPLHSEGVFYCPHLISVYDPCWKELGLEVDPYLRAWNYSAAWVAETSGSPVGVVMSKIDCKPAIHTE